MDIELIINKTKNSNSPIPINSNEFNVLAQTLTKKVIVEDKKYKETPDYYYVCNYNGFTFNLGVYEYKHTINKEYIMFLGDVYDI